MERKMITPFEKLRQLRKVNEITLTEVAAKTGLSIGYLNRIERGYIPNIKNLRKKQRLLQYIEYLKQATRQNQAFRENFLRPDPKKSAKKTKKSQNNSSELKVKSQEY